MGAFNRRERFVELNPYNVGLMDGLDWQKDLKEFSEATYCKGEIRIKKHQIGLLEGMSQHVSMDREIQDLLRCVRSVQSIESQGVSSRFFGKLYSYQQTGLNWLSFLYHSGLNGLLADDMGLGKTVQILGFLSTISLEKPVLIVAPTSLIFHWKKEWERFLPDQKVFIYRGKDRITQLQELPKNGVILVSYPLLRIDSALFSKIEFSSIILDEAQWIKNPDSQIANACFHLKSSFRLAITGTPVENRWDDLWSIFHFLEPQLLGQRQEFDARMIAGQVDDRYIKQMKRKISPFILRRTKKEVALDLPEKIIQTVWVEMTEPQREKYETLLSKNRKEFQGDAVKSMEVLEALLRLRQICCHPCLVHAEIPSDPEYSAKLERILADIEEVVQEGRKVIVFSQFTQMLHVLQAHLIDKGIRFVYLDGSTKDREHVVQQFQQDQMIPVFLMSLKAGGVGLNLTAADYVFLFDPWWNEAVEMQAIDRAHRVGRKDVVVARRYVMAESVEEKMMKLKEKKAAIAQGLMENGSDIAPLTMDELIELFS